MKERRSLHHCHYTANGQITYKFPPFFFVLFVSYIAYKLGRERENLDSQIIYFPYPYDGVFMWLSFTREYKRLSLSSDQPRLLSSAQSVIIIVFLSVGEWYLSYNHYMNHTTIRKEKKNKNLLSTNIRFSSAFNLWQRFFFCVLKPIEYKGTHFWVTREILNNFNLGGIMPHFDGVVAVTSSVVMVVLEPGDYSVSLLEPTCEVPHFSRPEHT